MHTANAKALCSPRHWGARRPPLLPPVGRRNSSPSTSPAALAREDADGKQIAPGYVPKKAQRYSISAGEGTDVGIDNETAVSTDYEPATSKFTVKIESVTIAVAPSKLTAGEQKAIGDVGEAADKADD
jgi:hypothetical protein